MFRKLFERNTAPKKTKIILPENHTRVELEESSESKNYYRYLDNLKDIIDITPNTTYIHFRDENNDVHPISNKRDGVFSIGDNKKILNLKSPSTISALIKKTASRLNFENLIFDSFVDFFVREVYKCLEAKYLYNDNFDVISCIDMFVNYEISVREYESYTGFPVMNRHIKYHINTLFQNYDLRNILLEVEKDFSDYVHQTINFSKISKETNIEFFTKDKIYNKNAGNDLLRRVFDDIPISSEETRHKRFVMFDCYPIDFFDNASIPAQSRAAGIKLIFPFSHLDKEDEFLNANSFPADLKNLIK